MPKTGFRVQIVLPSKEAFERLKHKLESFSDVFDKIIDRWLAHNEAKFEIAQGAQASGAAMPGSDVFWHPLSEKYRARKMREGYDDWLMVREGDLIESLTDRGHGSFFEEITDTSARWGTLLKQAFYNWDTRPTMFLDAEDEATINDMFVAYLEDEAPFKPWTPPAGRRLDLEFAATVGGR